MTTSSRIAVVALAVAGLTCAGCGGGSSPAPAVPADIAASIKTLGGDPATELTTVVPGKVYRTPNGYLFGYCGADPALTQVVSGDICFSLSK